MVYRILITWHLHSSLASFEAAIYRSTPAELTELHPSPIPTNDYPSISPGRLFPSYSNEKYQGLGMGPISMHNTTSPRWPKNKVGIMCLQGRSPMAGIYTTGQPIKVGFAAATAVVAQEQEYTRCYTPITGNPPPELDTEITQDEVEKRSLFGGFEIDTYVHVITTEAKEGMYPRSMVEDQVRTFNTAFNNLNRLDKAC
ncbi:hypothetical protein KC354_g7 [Hortaea werneckii]|nr:hypothetical protein KC354_g7 [Hortaea werneckii]